MAELLVIAVLAAPAGAATEQVLYNFPESNSAPVGALHQDGEGTLYGVAYYLGVYRLKEKNGSWGFSLIYGDDGLPSAGLVEDSTTANLYGVTVYGGAYGLGSVFGLAQKRGTWRQNLLHSFSGADGSYAQATLFKDKSTGALFGTTFYGGTYNCGTVFQLTPARRDWTFQPLYSFKGGTDGCTSVVQLRQGLEAGTLIGATSRFTSPTTVFEIEERHGAWTETPIYTFSDDNWATDLDTDESGTVYGVAYSGGDYDQGMVFQLVPFGKTWSFSILYSFAGGSDGLEPFGINYDRSTGSLYGTTFYGGVAGGGTVFQLVNSGGSWTKTILHNFAGGSDGANPRSRPIVDRTTGVLYGTTTYGGAHQGGVVYAVQP